MGIRANLRRETDWGTYLERRNNLEYPFWMLGWTGDNGDPDNFLWTFFGTYPDNSWDNEAVKGLLRQAQRSPDLGGAGADLPAGQCRGRRPRCRASPSPTPRPR